MRRVREEVDRPRLHQLKRDARKGGGRGAAETDCVGHKRGRVAGDEEEAAERRATAQRLDHVGVEAGAGRIDDGDQRVELRRSEPLEHLPRRLLRLGADELGVGDAVAGGVGGRIGNRLRVALDANHSLDRARHRQPDGARAAADVEQHRVGAEAALRAQQRQQALRAERVDLEECVGRDAEGEAEQRLLDVLPPEYRLDTLRLG
mmetsp:Transcript_33796/g.111797  ORF Transcript_33796/g.111797 Transcript_33796/m.111797 type:complete len:205 (+) Transcript_33796:496-1110(+)